MKLIFRNKKMWGGACCKPSFVDWMPADLNASLQTIKRGFKGWDLSALNDWRSLGYVTKKKSVQSKKNKLGQIVHDKTTEMHLENRVYLHLCLF